MSMLALEPGRVTVVTLNRPPANALNGAFFAELTALLERLAAADDVRAVVLTGAGRFFSAGLDLYEVFGYPPDGFADFTARFDAGFAAAFAFPKPLVAAVNGHAVAGGAVLAATADVRLMSEGEGRVGFTEILVGVPFPASILEIVRASCGGPHLPELLYLGRTYQAAEARVRRLVDEVMPPEELLPRAQAVAEELASRDGSIFASIKATLRADALRVIRSMPPGTDPVWDVWRGPETRAAVEAYRARTLARKSRLA
jgi:enoyl-CoA hydratase